MDGKQYLDPFSKSIRWGLAFLTIGLLVLFSFAPLSNERRSAIIALVLLVGFVGLASLRYLVPKLKPSNALGVYGGITFHCISIAAGEYILSPLDISALYIVRIIASAMLWDRKAALFTALFATFLTALVNLFTGISLADHATKLILQSGIYILSAYLISEFNIALTTRWRVATAITEQQNQEISKRNAELELLFEISQSFGNLKDIDALLRQLTERVANVLHGAGCMIATVDPVTKQVRGMPPGFGLTDDQISQFQYEIRGDMLGTWDMRTAQYFISRDPSQLPRELADFAELYQINQLVAARMIIQGIPTGYVVVGNKTDGTRFTDSDARLLTILAEQIGITVENARLYAEERTNLQNAARLYAISTELLSGLNPEEIPHRVISTVAEALHAPIATIALLNENTGLLEYKAQIGMPKDALAIPFRRGGLGMTVVESNVPRYIEDQSQVEDPSLTTKTLGSRSVACLPIRRGDKRIGALYVNYTESHVFTSAEKSLLAIFANQIAIALENSQLYARERQRAAELDVIAQIGQRVTSILTLDDLLPALVNLIQTKFNYRYIHFFINDNPHRRTVLRAVQGSNLQPIEPGDFALKFEEGMIGWVAQHGATLVANDVSKEPRHLTHPDLSDARSELAVPVKVGNEIIGVLDVESEKLDSFQETRVAMFETLAGQVAVAIENARLYTQLQDQARRDSLTQVFNHGYFIDQLNIQVGLAFQNNLPLSLIMLDIDHYKKYNDTYGHVVGDHVLNEIVQAIRANIKSRDIVGRWGGEEFGIVLPGATSESARHVADRIRQTLLVAKLTTQEGVAIIPPTISQGIASIPEHTQDAATLIDLADAALYRAKDHGRDQVQIAQPKEYKAGVGL